MNSSTRAENFYRPLAVSLMVVCVLISPVSLAQMQSSTWNGAYLVLLCGFAAMEAMYSHRVAHAPAFDSSARVRLRILELALLFIVLQLCVDGSDAQPPFTDGVPNLDWKTVFLFIPLGLSWAVGADVAAIFKELSEPLFSGPQVSPGANRLVSRFFLGGALLFIMAALTQPQVADAMHISSSSVAGPVANVLLYFVIGIVLLGHVQFATLKQRWAHHNVAVVGGLSARWVRYSFAFIGLVTIVALILPTSQTGGLLGQGHAVWDEILTLLRGPLTRLLTILGKTARPKDPLLTPPPITLPPLRRQTPRPHHGASSTGGASWGALLQSLFFWGVVGLSVFYLLRIYLQRRRGVSRTGGRLSSSLSVLARLWNSLLRALRQSVYGLGDLLPRVHVQRRRGGASAPGIRRFVRVHGLTPRDQILHFYLSTVRRAERRGVQRQSTHTPHEFGEILTSHIPPARADVDVLTEAFVEARYSRHGVDVPTAKRVRVSWRKIREALSSIEKR